MNGWDFSFPLRVYCCIGRDCRINLGLAIVCEQPCGESGATKKNAESLAPIARGELNKPYVRCTFWRRTFTPVKVTMLTSDVSSYARRGFIQLTQGLLADFSHAPLPTIHRLSGFSWRVSGYIYALNLRRLATVFFDLGVYLLKSKFRIEDKLRFPWYYTTFSIYDQSLFFYWFPSNNCHHSNGNGQPLILNNVEYLVRSEHKCLKKIYQTQQLNYLEKFL